MEPTQCRLLPFAVADGPHNMAADEALLESAAGGVTSLRFYGWSEPTLSLGYFQPEALRRADPLTGDLPFVRRATGGAALVHHHEVTYALALPSGGSCWLCRMHHVIADALSGVGVANEVCEADRPPPAPGLLCFQHHTPGDVLIGSAKVVGSAQRRQKQALLQHGGILLAASPFAPVLPGIRELQQKELTGPEVAALVVQKFTAETGWHVVPGLWTEAEGQRTEALVREKYGHDAWNRKR